MRYKIGDTVKVDSYENIKSRGKLNNDGNIVFGTSHIHLTPYMSKRYSGKSMTISGMDTTYPHGDKFYLLEEDSIGFAWCDEMFVDKTKERFDMSELVILI